MRIWPDWLRRALRPPDGRRPSRDIAATRRTIAEAQAVIREHRDDSAALERALRGTHRPREDPR